MENAKYLLGLFVGLIGGFSFYNWIWNRLVKRWDKKRFLNFYPTKNKEERLLIVVPTQKIYNTSPNVITTHEDAMAQAELQCEFIKYGITHDIVLDRDVTDQLLRERNIILICGPGGNSITKKLYNHNSHGIPVNFLNKNGAWSIINPDKHPWNRDKAVTGTDYGILVRTNNPWSRQNNLNKWLILGAGIEGLGTWGAIHVISQKTKELWGELKSKKVDKSNPRFWAIIKATRNKSQSPTTSISESGSI
jgi:hypothetical protein